ncbi:MAG: hypothetical protein GDA43_16830 [Hormoscilla sp. SP5CHS1]|nr:hypothetical protein [Hormoscilla sp. SP12CHS1]MBC6454657.1 hypothetical protein [Hormoscilla sp. SP5CHS1]
MRAASLALPLWRSHSSHTLWMLLATDGRAFQSQDLSDGKVERMNAMRSRDRVMNTVRSRGQSGKRYRINNCYYRSCHQA